MAKSPKKQKSTKEEKNTRLLYFCTTSRPQQLLTSRGQVVKFRKLLMTRRPSNLGTKEERDMTSVEVLHYNSTAAQWACERRALECLSIVREEKILKNWRGSEKIGGSRQSIRNATKFTLGKEFPRNVFHWKKYYFYDHLESNFHFLACAKKYKS